MDIYLSLPSSYDEMTDEQFLSVAPLLREGTRLRELAERMMDLPSDVELTPVQWRAVMGALEWMMRPEGLSVFLPRMFNFTDYDDELLYPPADDLSDVSWQTFILAEAYAYGSDGRTLAALLYHPAACPLSGETDEGEVMKRWERLGADERLEGLSAAVLVSYRAARRRLADGFPHLFVAEETDPTEEDVDFYRRVPRHRSRRKDLPPPWLQISRRLLGDQFFQEPQLMRLPAQAVLFRLDELARRG